MAKAVDSVLRNTGIRYNVEDGTIFSFGVTGEHARFTVRIICEEEMELFIMAVSCGMMVPTERRDRMCRWIADRNWYAVTGEFKLDTSDGDLMFRITCPAKGVDVTEKTLMYCLAVAFNSFDRAYEEIVRVIYSDDGESGDQPGETEHSIAGDTREHPDETPLTRKKILGS